jgi:chemotaxis protein methyltransferase CheR
MIGAMALEKLSNDDYKWFQGWLKESSSIHMDDGRKFVAEKRLHPLLWKHKIPTFRELCAYLRRGLVLDLQTDVMEAITGNDTWFFRDPAAFEQLRTLVLPELLRARKSARRLRVWSAGCATGQEAYSLAILLAEIPQLADWDVEILATDLSKRHVQRAAEGAFSRDEVSRGLPSKLLTDYFTQDGLNWVAKPALRHRTCFLEMRLDEPWTPMPAFDLIVMRNVLFHFDQATRRDLCQRMQDQLRPEGVLMLGANEHNELAEGFEATGDERNHFYRKFDMATAARAA